MKQRFTFIQDPEHGKQDKCFQKQALFFDSKLQERLIYALDFTSIWTKKNRGNQLGFSSPKKKLGFRFCLKCGNTLLDHPIQGCQNRDFVLDWKRIAKSKILKLQSKFMDFT